jgi:hypothetical protein
VESHAHVRQWELHTFADTLSRSIVISLLEHRLVGAWLLARDNVTVLSIALSVFLNVFVNLLVGENTGTQGLDCSITKVVKEERLTGVPYQPCSPDLTPSDFHLFSDVRLCLPACQGILSFDQFISIELLQTC